jgi:pSer/pThr/pTyr-binding forkhead associated (FHA) protein
MSDSDKKNKNLSEDSTINLPNQQNSETGFEFIDETAIPADGISFYILRLSKSLIMPGNVESFFIGRNAQEDSAAQILDLEDLEGFAMGVSRRHALVRINEQGYEVIDLSSRNGTWLDGQRLVPNKPYPLRSGTALRVGQERLLVRYRPFK